MLKIIRAQILLFLLAVLILWPACKLSPDYKADKSAIGTEAMVVTPHPLATEVGLEIIRQGGNAADAAIAVKFALAVVYPRAGNIGGGGFLLYRSADGETEALDFREKAPMAANRDMFLDSLGNPVTTLSLEGHLAAGVPGTVDGMVKLFECHSRLKNWNMLLEPAIRLAQNGFRISQAEAERLNTYAEDFLEHSTQENPFLSRKIWRAGQVLIQHDLGKTLERIRDMGEAGFYAGETAALIEAEMERGGGLITSEDLIGYNAVWRDPVIGSFRDLRVISMPPPSSGGIALLQLLKLTESKLGPAAQSIPNSHLMVEAMRRVYADRARYLGDTDYYPVPIDSLLNEKYLQQRMQSFNARKAGVSSSTFAGDFQVDMESFETTHISIIDPEGNAISLSTTLNSSYGCKVLVGGAGFFLNNQMDDFSVKPGVANQFGLVGNEANAIRPGKRMLSSMTPTIVERDGTVYLVIGSPGGSTIITSVYQVILNTSIFGMPLAEAIALPRFHHQWLPDAIWYERNGFSLDWLEDMQALGHQLTEKKQLGRVKAILRDADGTLYGAGDPRQPDDDAGGW